MWHMHVVSMQKWHPFGWVRVNFSWYPLDIVLSCTRFPSFTLPWCWLASCWSYVFLRMAMAVAADEAACLGEAIPRVDMKSVELQEYCSVGCCKLFVIYVSSYDMSSVSRVCTHLEYWERVPFWSVLARRCCHRSNEIYLTFMISFGVDFWPFLETNGKTTTYVYSIYIILVFLFGYLFYHPQWLVHFSLKSRSRVECLPFLTASTAWRIPMHWRDGLQSCRRALLFGSCPRTGCALGTGDRWEMKPQKWGGERFFYILNVQCIRGWFFFRNVLSINDPSLHI